LPSFAGFEAERRLPELLVRFLAGDDIDEPLEHWS
jgi:hypothetical protein